MVEIIYNIFFTNLLLYLSFKGIGKRQSTCTANKIIISQINGHIKSSEGRLYPHMTTITKIPLQKYDQSKFHCYGLYNKI